MSHSTHWQSNEATCRDAQVGQQLEAFRQEMPHSNLLAFAQDVEFDLLFSCGLSVAKKMVEKNVIQGKVNIISGMLGGGGRARKFQMLFNY